MKHFYLYPPRATTAVPRGDNELFKQMKWIAQYKYNDTRCVIAIEEKTELWNRHEQKIQYTPTPELANQLDHIKQLLQTKTMLDGGLIHSKHQLIRNTIAIWDILVHNDKHLLGTTYQERYDLLKNIATNEPYTFRGIILGYKITENIFIPECHDWTKWDGMWENVDKVNSFKEGTEPILEGLMFKDPQGVLKNSYGQNNNSGWQTRSRITTKRHKF